jgi:pimeloyl-ACP methyl ester carboxylesterase
MSTDPTRTEVPAMHSYRTEFPQADLDDLRRRLDATRWPAEIAGAGWSRGVPVGYLRELTGYWRDQFDWRAVEARLNAHQQSVTRVDGASVHIVHVRSPEPDAVPLLITHGWPGSVLEFLDVIGPLTDPRTHGGDPARAFHLVLPTVPGHGLSGPAPDAGWGLTRVAAAWAEIMRRLGYDRYLVQGGDIGSWVGLTLAALDAGHVMGTHVNFLVTAPGGPADLAGLGPADMQRIGRLGDFFENGSGYMRLQATRPQTVAYPLTDSPVGQLAWIVEKYREWSGCTDVPEEVISRDDILANATLAWLTATGGSSAQFYYEIADQIPGAPTASPPPPLSAPLAVSVYPDDPVPPVRALADRMFPGIIQWREHSAGGHFAALEQPELFVGDLRDLAAAIACDSADDTGVRAMGRLS